MVGSHKGQLALSGFDLRNYTRGVASRSMMYLGKVKSAHENSTQLIGHTNIPNTINICCSPSYIDLL